MSDGGSRRVESDGGACRPIAPPEYKEPNHRLLGLSLLLEERESLHSWASQACLSAWREPPDEALVLLHDVHTFATAR